MGRGVATEYRAEERRLSVPGLDFLDFHNPGKMRLKNFITLQKVDPRTGKAQMLQDIHGSHGLCCCVEDCRAARSGERVSSAVVAEATNV